MEEDREEGCENEAVEQVCFADKVFLNKIDLADRETLDAATKKIRQHNTQAVVEEVQFNNEELPLLPSASIVQLTDRSGLPVDTQRGRDTKSHALIQDDSMIEMMGKDNSPSMMVNVNSDLTLFTGNTRKNIKQKEQFAISQNGYIAGGNFEDDPQVH